MMPYAVRDYGRMIGDAVRMDAYREAMRRTVAPGAIVLDIGTGTGIFAFIACRLGAARVYAVEPGDVIQVAREIAAANGFSDRICFFQEDIKNVDLPEQVQVIVSDLRGILPQASDHIPAIAHARERCLAPGGILIPRKDHVFAAVVEAEIAYRNQSAPWHANDYGLDLRAAQLRQLSVFSKARANPDQLLVDPVCWTTVDYETVCNPDVAGSAQWTVRRSGLAHGLIVWFDAELADGVGFSNAPDQPETIYGEAFFPWLEPVPLIEGDVVVADFKANLVGADYVWRWTTTVQTSTGLKATFRQSSFDASLVSPGTLRHRASSHVPGLSENGEVDALILDLMRKGLCLGAIAERIGAHFPARFAKEGSALAHVGQLSQRYSR